ncbi:MAG: PadR family transcriptional regulator [Lentisphaeria bacterium]|nr:PadR family transcriptional regulator [Candidatus Neomarinimicrobiota bacterium]MCF7842953.1 PadR family transcriptional regulator [Lentisphaeria bacterium]
MDTGNISSDLIRGHIDTIILRLLLDGDKYGYQISKSILTTSGGEFELKEATMYSSLKRMEKAGLITSYWGDETQGARRKYYRITQRGGATYAAKKQSWEYAKHIIDQLI